jgi:HAMP domain-containing protein
MRARVTVLFFLAGLLLASALALLTFSLARRQLANQREDVALRQAFVNASVMRELLRNERLSPNQIIFQVRPDNGGFALYHFNSDDRWFGQSNRFGFSDLPASLRKDVLDGDTSRERFVYGGQPYLAVGVNVAEFDVQYFEVFPLAPLVRSLRVVGGSLVLGSTVAAILAAAVGWSASRRLLRPVSRVADAASELASGGLDTRLEPERDPDLDRLVTSFNDMADAVQDRIEREARFASDVSHELRSPITALSAAVELLDGRREELPERSQQALDVVVNQVHRFDQMVLDLLELSRLEAGVDESHQEPVVLSDIVRKIVARNGYGDVPFDASRRSEVPVILDRRRVERIVVNLWTTPEPRRRPVASRPGGRQPGHAAPGRRGFRSRRAPGRAGPGVRALLPWHRGPPAGGHRPGPGPGQRARHGHGWPGLGRRPSRRRSTLRGVDPRGQGVRRGEGVRSAHHSRRRPSRTADPRVLPGAMLCVAIAVALVTWACGVAPEATPRTVDRANIPFGLDDTSTTSTTTTLPATTTETTLPRRRRCPRRRPRSTSSRAATWCPWTVTSPSGRTAPGSSGTCRSDRPWRSGRAACGRPCRSAPSRSSASPSRGARRRSTSPPTSSSCSRRRPSSSWRLASWS